MSRRTIPIERLLRRRLTRRGPVPIIVVLLLIAMIWADRSGLLLEPSDDWSRFHGQTMHVHRVVDGDTFDMLAPDDLPPGAAPGVAPDKDTLTRVRFWAINTPEMARSDTGQPAQPFAQEATDLTRQLCEGKIVTIELERHDTRGRYGRLLAFVILDDGRCLNAVLVEEGLARVERRFSHSRMEEYDALEKQAKASGKGIWGGGG